ncbi:Glucose-1-phosphate cytidylyltransferase [Vibrio cholerae]|nr:Glucose-1-phosphate cytidylyltransferase [Vibrio cholerae]BCN22131.1 putative monosaccharide biosynthesis protein [Vibrio cholerae]
MKVIILAAGQGTRLRPHTDHQPKCMVELAGKPLLHHQLAALRAVGLSNIMLIGGYCADKLDAPDAERAFNPRFDQTNMVGTLFCAENWMTPGEDFLIAYGDIVYEQRVLKSLLQTDAPVVISVDRQWQRLWETRMENPLSDAETLKLTDGNRVSEVGKKPTSLDEIQGQYMGLIKVRGDFVLAFRDFWHALDRTALYDGKDFDNMYMTSLLQQLIDSGIEIRAAFTDNGWIEVDTVDDLEHYEAMYKDGSLDAFVRIGN